MTIVDTNFSIFNCNYASATKNQLKESDFGLDKNGWPCGTLFLLATHSQIILGWVEL